ncbi:hypothetical protein KCV87_10775 [Actinosynnema pretiosum subsp. pretiosum]|uniref:Fido domain-containing protein n=1 Tax=Actinosynnema pretiosum subsp. pretiosum TaxID=103721 RepID=A0AA45LA51_9PSEU|nr:hypothetical protein KCV87_10775 [Actinosynnema pretiosum subsp. pretiosum]
MTDRPGGPTDPDFVGPPLPIPVQRLLGEAEHALGGLDEAAWRLPDRSVLARCARIRDARGAAARAGRSADLVDAWLFADLGTGTPPDLLLRAVSPGEDEQDVPPSPVSEGAHPPFDRYLAALELGADLLARGRALDVQLLAEVGAVRAHGRGAPPLAGSTALRTWSVSTRALEPLPRIARLALEHRLLALHPPFPDAAAAVTSLRLVGSGLLRDQILPLSVWLDTHADRRDALLRGSPAGWVEFFARGVRELARAQTNLIEELAALRAHHLNLVPHPRSARRVAADLVASPVLTHPALVRRYGFTAKTATDVTRRLLELGLVTTLDDRPYRKVFLCVPALRLLTTEPPGEPIRDEDVFKAGSPE